jgi:hypothetical protein
MLMASLLYMLCLQLHLLKQAMLCAHRLIIRPVWASTNFKLNDILLKENATWLGHVLYPQASIMPCSACVPHPKAMQHTNASVVVRMPRTQVELTSDIMSVPALQQRLNASNLQCNSSHKQCHCRLQGILDAYSSTNRSSNTQRQRPSALQQRLKASNLQ